VFLRQLQETTRLCENPRCGKEFAQPLMVGRPGRFCSDSCRYAAYALRRKEDQQDQ
jgi:hypothetical protein